MFLFAFCILSFYKGGEALGPPGCNYPCNRHVVGKYVNVIGQEYKITEYSCNQPNVLYRNTGEAVECVEQKGPFLLQRRQGNQYRCMKGLAYEAAGAIFKPYYGKPWRKYKSVPSVCEVCGTKDGWKFFLDVAPGTSDKVVKRALAAIPPVGCNVPPGCPKQNPYVDVVCPHKECSGDGGVNCKVCYRNDLGAFKYGSREEHSGLLSHHSTDDGSIGIDITCNKDITCSRFELIKHASAIFTQTTFHVEKNKVTVASISDGISCQSKTMCAHICKNDECCSASFSVVRKLCVLTPYDMCLSGSMLAYSDDWITIMRCKTFYRSKKTWDDAQAFCKSKGGRLATIRTADDNDEALRLIKGNNVQSTSVWIGGTDRHKEGSFDWEGTLEQVSLNERYWIPGEPNNYEEQ